MKGGQKDEGMSMVVRMRSFVQTKIRQVACSVFGMPVERYDKFRGIAVDSLRFFGMWVEKPLLLGAIIPSGRRVCQTMASYVDTEVEGQVIELGPGTGVVTERLVERGVKPERLVLIEYDPEFCKMLRERYPAATVIQGDAYALKKMTQGIVKKPCAAVISALPLYTKPVQHRTQLVQEAFDIMHPNCPFVQVTYGMKSPIPAEVESFTGVTKEQSGRIWLNVPPAHVFAYRRDAIRRQDSEAPSEAPSAASSDSARRK